MPGPPPGRRDGGGGVGLSIAWWHSSHVFYSESHKYMCTLVSKFEEQNCLSIQRNVWFFVWSHLKSL